jgi:hypothetical protein
LLLTVAEKGTVNVSSLLFTTASLSSADAGRAASALNKDPHIAKLWIAVLVMESAFHA